MVANLHRWMHVATNGPFCTFYNLSCLWTTWVEGGGEVVSTSSLLPFCICNETTWNITHQDVIHIWSTDNYHLQAELKNKWNALIEWLWDAFLSILLVCPCTVIPLWMNEFLWNFVHGMFTHIHMSHLFYACYMPRPSYQYFGEAYKLWSSSLCSLFSVCRYFLRKSFVKKLID
jgi:hypothetical protein